MPNDTTEPEKSERVRRGRRSGRVQDQPAANTIEPTPAVVLNRRDIPPEDKRGEAAAAAPDADRPSAPAQRSGPDAPSGFKSVPDSVLDRYYRIGSKYFLDNGDIAFTHEDRKLVTPSENTQIARDLVEIAHHNGVRDITVTGTDRFRREVWAAATRRGMEVRGYEPTLHDEKQLVRAMAHEKSQASVDRDRTPPLDTPGSASNAGIEELGPEQKRSGRRGSQVGELPVLDDRLYSGELLAHGQEHYKRDPREEMSYYVQVDGPDGMVELWGKDLQRALEQSKSGVRVGDRVVVRQTGQQGVTVWAREFDDAGNVVGKREKDTHRNAWSVEKEDFATDRAELARIVLDRNVPAERGAREHPQLVGTYFALKHAELFAKNLLETKEHQQQFVDALRERIAQSIERGDPLPMTKIRDRRPERARETADREPPMRRGPDPVLV